MSADSVLAVFQAGVHAGSHPDGSGGPHPAAQPGSHTCGWSQPGCHHHTNTTGQTVGGSNVSGTSRVRTPAMIACVIVETPTVGGSGYNALPYSGYRDGPT